MIKNIDKTKPQFTSSRQKRKYTKDDNLAHVYGNFDLQIPICEKDKQESV